MRTSPDETFIAGLDLGKPPKRHARADALRRFGQRLLDAGPSGDRWADTEARHDLVGAAGRFLVEVDCAFDVASLRQPERSGPAATPPERLDELLVTQSASSGWSVVWYHAVLDLFSRRVIGLGERDTANLWDAHAPVAGRSPSA